MKRDCTVLLYSVIRRGNTYRIWILGHPDQSVRRSAAFLGIVASPRVPSIPKATPAGPGLLLAMAKCFDAADRTSILPLPKRFSLSPNLNPSWVAWGQPRLLWRRVANPNDPTWEMKKSGPPPEKLRQTRPKTNTESYGMNQVSWCLTYLRHYLIQYNITVNYCVSYQIGPEYE